MFKNFCLAFQKKFFKKKFLFLFKVWRSLSYFFFLSQAIIKTFIYLPSWVWWWHFSWGFSNYFSSHILVQSVFGEKMVIISLWMLFFLGLSTFDESKRMNIHEGVFFLWGTCMSVLEQSWLTMVVSLKQRNQNDMLYLTHTNEWKF